MVTLAFMIMNSILGRVKLIIQLRQRWEVDAIRMSRRIYTQTLASTRVVSSISTSMTSFKRTEFLIGSDNFQDTTIMSQPTTTQGERLVTSYTPEILFHGRLNVKALYHARMHSHSSNKDFLSPTTQSFLSFGPPVSQD